MYPLPNLYRYQGSMIWSDFAHIIRKAALSYTAIKFAGPIKQPNDIVTILDYNRPRREGRIHTTQFWDDWSRDSICCNAAWLDGEIPIIGWDGGDIVTDSMSGVQVAKKRPARGVVATLRILAKDGIINPYDEDIKQLLEIKSA